MGQQAMSGRPGERNDAPENRKSFDIVRQRDEWSAALTGSKEVDDIVSALDVYSSASLVTFGSRAAKDLSQVFDQFLSCLNRNQPNDFGPLLTALGGMMEKFDPVELACGEKRGKFSMLFGAAQKGLDSLLEKYRAIGDETGKIYIQLKQYEEEIQSFNRKLEALFEATLGYYRQLVLYILAGEQAVRELGAHLTRMRTELAANPEDSALPFDTISLDQAQKTLEHRVQDLRIAEHLALQSLPMLQSMQDTNCCLTQKISSAFLITLPVFKQALAQTVQLKRQKIQAEAMEALDMETNRVLLQNPQNTALRTNLAARLVTGSSIKMEALAQTRQTILTGIQETRQLDEIGKAKRKEAAECLRRLVGQSIARPG